MNSFLRTGGDGFTVLTEGQDAVVGPVDLDALVAHVAALTAASLSPAGFEPPALGRIHRLH